MKLCPECKSDSLEKSSSTGLRVIICIILLFIPFGIFFCWIPFVFPHSYRCNVCGTDIKESELIDIDWREKEIILEQYKRFEDKLNPFLDKWNKDKNENLYKVVKGKGQFILLEFRDNDIYPARIIDFVSENGINKLVIKKKLTSEFRVLELFSAGSQGLYNMDNKEENPEDRLTSFGKLVISKEEFLNFKSGKDSFKAWLKQNKELLENMEIVEKTF